MNKKTLLALGLVSLLLILFTSFSVSMAHRDTTAPQFIKTESRTITDPITQEPLTVYRQFYTVTIVGQVMKQTEWAEIVEVSVEPEYTGSIKSLPSPLTMDSVQAFVWDGETRELIIGTIEEGFEGTEGIELDFLYANGDNYFYKGKLKGLVSNWNNENECRKYEVRVIAFSPRGTNLLSFPWPFEICYQESTS